MTLQRVGWVVIGLVVAALLPLGFEGAYDLNLVTNLAFFIIVASSLNVVSGLTGQLSVGHSGFLLLGAYSAAVLQDRYESPKIYGFLLAAVLCGVLAWILGKVCLRLEAFYLAMVTLAIALSLVAIADQWDAVTHGQDGMVGIPRLFDLEEREDVLRLTLTVMTIAAVLALMVVANLRKSHYGRAFEAVRVNPLVAAACGVDTARARIRAFVVSGVMAGLAGALFAHWQTYISPGQFGMNLSLLLLLMMTLGGRGSVFGVAIAAAGLALLPDLTREYGDYHPVIYGILLVVVAAFVPRGIAGIGSTVFSRFARRRTAPEVGALHVDDIVPQPPVALGEDLLVVSDIVKRYGGVTAVDGLNMRVAAGTIHSLIGPNGSGKSTTINCITGFTPPNGGSIVFAGREITGQPRHEVAEMGMRRTFQTGRVLPEISVLDNVMLGAHGRVKVSFLGALFGSLGTPREERRLRDEALQILRWLGIEDRAYELPTALSAGHQRFLEIARVLMGRPAIVLLDEPAAGLSTGDIEELDERLRSLRDAGLTIVLVEHHLELVLGISDRITVLDYGKVIADGSPDEVRGSRKVVEAYLGVEYAGSAQEAGGQQVTGVVGPDGEVSPPTSEVLATALVARPGHPDDRRASP